MILFKLILIFFWNLFRFVPPIPLSEKSISARLLNSLCDTISFCYDSKDSLNLFKNLQLNNNYNSTKTQYSCSEWKHFLLVRAEVGCAVTLLGNIDLLMTEKPSLDMPSFPNGKFPYLLLNLVEFYQEKLSRAGPMQHVLFLSDPSPIIGNAFQ